MIIAFAMIKKHVVFHILPDSTRHWSSGAGSFRPVHKNHDHFNVDTDADDDWLSISNNFNC